jgi:hypothetical protein
MDTYKIMRVAKRTIIYLTEITENFVIFQETVVVYDDKRFMPT